MREPVVFVIDDDSAVRDSLCLLIRSVGLTAVAFEHPQQFLDQFTEPHVGCLLLDIRMPGTSGLAFQETLTDLGLSIPIIFITGHGDVNQCSRAFKAGAVDFLTKPIDEHALIESVQKAIASSVATHTLDLANAADLKRFSLLSLREREILKLVVDGLSNKLIARKLGLSLRTIESHRARIFEKLEFRSLAECIKKYLTVLKLGQRN